MNNALVAMTTATRFWRLLAHGSAYFSNEGHANEFCKNLLKSGPVYVKIGQWMSQRPDLFGNVFAEKLRTLQQQAPSHSFHETEKILIESFGEKWEDTHLRDFKKIPIASGSVAQVYEAIWIGDGSPRIVAVKVRHPHIVEQFLRDLNALDLAIRVGKFLGNKYCKLIDFESVKRDMMSQLDMNTEKDNMEQFAKNFASNRHVGFPVPLWCNEQIIIETFVEGIVWSDIGTSRDPTHYKSEEEVRITKELCKQITMACYLQMMLHDGFLHGDCHNGNIVLQLQRRPEEILETERKSADYLDSSLDNGEERNDMEIADHRAMAVVYPVDVRVVFVDFGIVVKISEKHRKAHFDLMVGMYANDHPMTTEAFKVLLQEESLYDPEQFALFSRDLKETMTFLENKRRDENGVKLSDTMLSIIALLHRYQLRIDAGVGSMISGFILIDQGRYHTNSDNLSDNALRWILYRDEECQFPLSDYIHRLMAAYADRIQRTPGGTMVSAQTVSIDYSSSSCSQSEGPPLLDTKRRRRRL
jgi:predicted unusual protein kinase regulating ubiquinone biosynthesis (AarF/ABC1/UbiB family)